MLNDIITIREHHIQAAELVFETISEKVNKDKLIIAIAGEVASGKTTLAFLIGRMFKIKGKRSKIIDLVDFYKIPPIERREWREKHDINKIGADEYDWDLINKTIEGFQEGKKVTIPQVDLHTDLVDQVHTDFKPVDVLIVSGLYAFYCKPVDFKIFMELTYRETYETQKYTGKELMDSFRNKILELEHVAVQKQKDDADYYIDFDSFLNSYHL
jgi:uridine kinase